VCVECGRLIHCKFKENEMGVTYSHISPEEQAMIIRVACKVKDLQAAIDKAWTQAEAKKYPHA